MKELFETLNTAPILTYEWLGVNHGHLGDKQLPVLSQEVKKDISNKETVKINTITKNSKKNCLHSTAPMGEHFKNYVEGHANENLEIIVDALIEKPVIFNYTLENETLIEYDRITFDKGANATLIYIYRGQGAHLGIKEVISKKGSKGKIIKVNLLQGKSLELQETVVRAEEEGAIDIIHLNIGEDSIFDNINISLDAHAKGNIKGIYLGADKAQLDFNYVITHTGKKSESNMDVKGALLDEAEKIFRGTIDFKRGASGSKGKEEEYVMLLSENIRNRAMPLILCEEDDVSGEHAASCGRIDEEQLFYLMSRGLTKENSKKMIIEGSFNPILDQVPGDALRLEVQEVLKRRLLQNESI